MEFFINIYLFNFYCNIVSDLLLSQNGAGANNVLFKSRNLIVYLIINKSLF